MGGGGVREAMQQPTGQEARERHDERQQCNERWRRWQMGGSSVRRGDTTTIQTRCTRGDGTMRGGGASR
jgi:hypothetical protein